MLLHVIMHPAGQCLCDVETNLDVANYWPLNDEFKRTFQGPAPDLFNAIPSLADAPLSVVQVVTKIGLATSSDEISWEGN